MNCGTVRMPVLINARCNMSAQSSLMQVEVGSFPLCRTSFLSRKKAFTLHRKSLSDLRKSLPTRKKAYLKRQMSFPIRRKSATSRISSPNTPRLWGMDACDAAVEVDQHDVGQESINSFRDAEAHVEPDSAKFILLFHKTKMKIVRSCHPILIPFLVALGAVLEQLPIRNWGIKPLDASWSSGLFYL